jgi:DNA-binding response OmpR family regulator
MLKTLLLEDDPTLSSEIKSFLRGKQVECDTVFDGELFFKQIRNHTYDVYLLDVNVPKINGLEVCRIVRETDKNTPILMLTAFGEVEDKVEAFDFGADDYLVKPFHLAELLARIQALYRRKETPQLITNFTEIADLKIFPDEKKVERSGIEVALTPKEFKLLNILATAKGRVLSKQQIADELWDYHIETNHSTIEVYINFLRKKIDKEHNIKLIHTKVGYGYYLKEE